MRSQLVISLAALSCMLAGAATAQPPLPIFDAHIHYNREDWAQYSPQQLIRLWDEAGVTRALVSSTPDDGTLMLHAAAPQRVQPFLRPYRNDDDRRDWFASAEVLEYVEQRLERGIYRGIGEFHLYDAQYGTPQVQRLVALAVERDLVLHVHASAAIVGALQQIDPRAKILWAHAGVDESPGTIGETLRRYPTLVAELSVRAHHIAPAGRLDPGWRALFLRFPDRFMIGSDTARASRWQEYLDLIGDHRRWLAQLPPEVATKIAHRNAERYLEGR